MARKFVRVFPLKEILFVKSGSMSENLVSYLNEEGN